MKLAGISLLAFTALTGLAYADALTFAPNSNGQPVDFTVGAPVVGGPVSAAFSITGQLSSNTLTVTPPTTGPTPFIPIGAVITGSGVTAATITAIGANNTYTFSGSTQTVASESMTITPVLANSVQDALQMGAPTYGSLGCTTTPAFATGSTPYSWSLTNGASGCSSNSTIILSFPAAQHGWHCTATDTTTASHVIAETTIAAIASGRQSITFTDYVRTTGVAQTMAASDVIVGACAGY